MVSLKVGSYTKINSKEELSLVLTAYAKLGIPPYESETEAISFYEEYRECFSNFVYMVDTDMEGIILVPSNGTEEAVESLVNIGDTASEVLIEDLLQGASK